MINSKLLWISVMAPVALIASISAESALASIALLDEEEAVEAENTTTMATDGNNTDVQFMFIQRAQSGSLNEINATAYTLELNNVSDSTIMFSDRPERIVTTVSTSDFVGNWSKGPDSFALDAPNDALIVENSQTGNLETAIIESFSPVYDMATNTLTYTIRAENATSIDLHGEFGQAVLVIDQIGISNFTYDILCRHMS